MKYKEEKLDLHMRPLGDLYLKVPSCGAAQWKHTSEADGMI